MLVNPIITSKGLALLAKITTNTLTLSNMGIGDGEKEVSELVDSLANEKLKKQVEYVQMEDGVIDVRTTFTNETVETGFYIKEVGIYAIDPDEGEILYAYSSVNGTIADYFSPGVGSVLLREIVQLIVGFGNASGITLTIEPTSVYMTVDDYEKVSLPTFEDYETNTELPIPTTALSAIKTKGKLQTILSNIKAFLKQAVTWDKVAYNYTTNVKGYIADARCAKELKEQLDLLNTSLANQVGTSQGSNINLQNTFNGGLLLKELQGKSVQNGVPTPDAKVDIVSVGDNGSVVARVTGKNVLPKTTRSATTINGITFTPKSDGSVTANGTATSLAQFELIGQNIMLNGIYTWSGCPNGGGASGYNMGAYTIIKGVSDYSLDIGVGQTKTYNGEVYIKPTINIGSGITVNNLVFKPQLEIGKIITAYEQYKEQLITIPLTQPLRSVGSVYDRGCVKSGGLWGNERKLTKLIVDGSTYNLALNNSTASTIYNQFTITLPFNAKNNLLCNKLPKGGQVGPNTTNENIWLSLPNTLVIVLEKSKATTVAEFKTWLSNNPFEVILELATSTFEPFAQSIQDALNKLQSYQGVTNVFTTDALQPTLIVEYGKTDTAALTLYANNIYDNKIDKSKVTNSLAVTEDGFVADARGLKTLKDGLDSVNNNLLEKANKSDIPTSLPANGGNAATVGGFTVGTSVPANAKFTDTVYTHPATHPASMITGLPTSLPANGGNADTVDNIHISVVTSLPSSRDANTLYLVKG